MKKVNQTENKFFLGHSKKDIFKILTLTDFKLRYQNSVLGIIWVVLKPFLLFMVLYFVFSFLFAQTDPNYKFNLFMGIIMMSFFQEGTTVGLYSIFWRANILLKVNFPREIVLYSAFANSCISLLFNLVIFLIFWIITPFKVGSGQLGIFILLLITLGMLIQGVNYFLSILYVKFRDLSSIWEVIMSFLFYLTPVIYPLSVIPLKYHNIVLLNPLAVVIVNAKTVLIENASPDWKRILAVLLLAILLNLVGRKFFLLRIKSITEDF